MPLCALATCCGNILGFESGHGGPCDTDSDCAPGDVCQVAARSCCDPSASDCSKGARVDASATDDDGLEAQDAQAGVPSAGAVDASFAHPPGDRDAEAITPDPEPVPLGPEPETTSPGDLSSESDARAPHSATTDSGAATPLDAGTDSGPTVTDGGRTSSVWQQGDGSCDAGASAGCHPDDCLEGQACNLETGTCSAPRPDCAREGVGFAFCENQTLGTCEADLVNVSWQSCFSRCVTSDSGALCAPPQCGDGATQPPELCDDGNGENDDQCTNLCAAPTCGDGLLASNEECDDGNGYSGDGCSAYCRVERLALGHEHVCVITRTGAVKCWGHNLYGQLGLGHDDRIGDNQQEMADLEEVDLGSGRTAKSISAGAGHTCALLDNRNVKCWGENYNGQLGLGDDRSRGDDAGEMGDALPPVDLGPGTAARAVVAGEYHTCALLNQGAVKCWGRNIDGQLGLGVDIDVGVDASEMGAALPPVDLGTGRHAQAVYAGDTHTCAVLDDLSLKCWGDNFSGQLGLGDSASRGLTPSQMGDQLPAVPLGAVAPPQQLALATHSCALSTSGSLKCWGHNLSGQLGLEDATNRGLASADMGDQLPHVELGTGRAVRWVSASWMNTCAVLDDNSVKCWGLNDEGQLGLGHLQTLGAAEGDMGDNLPNVDLGTELEILQLAVGQRTACALFEDYSLKCWGANDEGQLGLGDRLRRGVAPDQMGENLPFVLVEL